MLDPSIPKGNPADINSPENRQINLEAGKKAIALLKNTNNVLPLKKSGTIALVGPMRMFFRLQASEAVTKSLQDKEFPMLHLH